MKNDWVKSVKQGTEKMSENTAKIGKKTETLTNQTIRIEQVKDDWVKLVIKKENKLNEHKSKRTEHND